MSDDFSEPVKRVLSARVGNHCSNPDCRALTSGPQDDPKKSINLGVAAHITAASPGGPRYDADLLPEERSASANGIWLCQNCAKLVDNDPARFSKEKLTQWKQNAELEARSKVGKTAASLTAISPVPRDLWSEDLERCANQMLDQMTYPGWLLLRHLLMHAPIEVIRQFMDMFSIDIQHEQMAIAMKSGVIRHSVKRQGAMTWTYYEISPQFQPIIGRVLSKRLQEYSTA